MASFPIRSKWFGWGKPDVVIEPPPAPAPPPAPRRAVKKKAN
jgi:hypothetical protein